MLVEIKRRAALLKHRHGLGDIGGAPAAGRENGGMGGDAQTGMHPGGMIRRQRFLSNTSSTAPPSRPLSSAASKSGRSTSDPRPALTRPAPRGIQPIVSARISR